MKIQSGWQHSRKIRSKHLFTQEQIAVLFFFTNKTFLTSSCPTTKLSLCDERGQSIILQLNFARGAAKTSNWASPPSQNRSQTNKEVSWAQKTTGGFLVISFLVLTVIRNVHIYARLLKSRDENVASSIKVSTKQTTETNRKTRGRIRIRKKNTQPPTTLGFFFKVFFPLWNIKICFQDKKGPAVLKSNADAHTEGWILQYKLRCTPANTFALSLAGLFLKWVSNVFRGLIDSLYV